MPQPDDIATTRSTAHTRLRDYFDNALQHLRESAIVLIDTAGELAGWNRGAEQMLGLRNDHLGLPSAQLFTPEDRANGVPAGELETAARTGEATDDRWHVRLDGSRFYGSGVVTAVRDGAGTLLGFVKLFRDLTAQRHAQEQLAESEERYRLLVDSITDYAIFMLDLNGCVSYWTKAAERIKGYTADEIVGKPFGTFFTEEDRARRVPELELRAARENGRAERSGWRVRKDGSLFWGDEIATVLRDASGAFIGYSKITRDSTERRRSELEREQLLREATEANRLKDEFLSTISHELRTPLNAILGWMQLIKLPGAVPDILPEALAVIERNARTQAHLIEDLLDVSRIVTGNTQLTLEPVVFAEPLAAAVETVKPTAEQKGVELVVHHNVAQDELNGDRQRLQQIVWNLLANAIKFTPPGGRVVASTSARNGSIELAITDSGVGIDPAFLPFVFERFRQADTTHTREHTGLGLGLSIVKHLVELHGGRVAIESAGRGHGTTARVTLPRLIKLRGAMDVAETSAGDTSPPRSLHAVAVLVVDDDEDARRMLELVLSAQGARVSIAASAREGLALAATSRPDVILSDLSMPHEDGFTLLKQLRDTDETSLNSVPVVAITAHARIEDRERSLAAGFDAFVSKPIDMNEVVDLVATLRARGPTA